MFCDKLKCILIAFITGSCVYECQLDLFQLHITLRFVSHGDLLWTCFKKSDVSSNWNLLFSSATKYCFFFVLRSFFTLTNRVYPDEMPHDGISPVYKSKKHEMKNIYSQLKCSGISFLTIFLVPYAFTGCNLRVRQFDVSASNMIIVFSSIFHQAHVNGQCNA